MRFTQKIKLVVLIAGVSAIEIKAEPDPNFHIYLLFGQSNMAGPCNNDNAIAEARDPQPEDCDTTPRVKVLAWGDCSRDSKPCPSLPLKRTYDRWYTAFPPYHNCHEGIGPADYFGKMLLDSIREDISIGFVPCALSGQKIEVFMKGKNAPIDAHTQPTNGSQKITSGGYEWMVKRAKIAQQTGVIKGILLHQGESNSGEGDAWVTKVKGIAADLKKDLGLGDIPFIAGELIQDPAADPNAKNLNPYVNKLPEVIPHCAVASSKDFVVRPGDTYRLHFSCSGIREFGRRYARAFLKLADNDFVPRKGTVKTRSGRSAVHQFVVNTTGGTVTIYTLLGRIVGSNQAAGIDNAFHNIRSGGVYLVSRKLDDGRTAVVPVIKE
ncbi:MAG: hypothetical protein JXA18_02355 [Chitinispirillaceae bacterium]|nr:hypothetical protein [Chitinispirillaceae bacterium]